MLSQPFLGAEALAAGTLNRHQLRTRCRRLFPGVYVDASTDVLLHTRIVAAWLWSRRRAVIGGLSAAALLGARWVDDDEPVDLICTDTRSPAGIRCRNDVLAAGERVSVRGLAVTSAARTGFDLARRGSVPAAVARVDALLHATGITPADIAAIAQRHPGSRGLRQLKKVLPLVDARAESPRETSVRLLLVGAGVTPPQTQLDVFDERGRFVARLDMAWSELMLAVEYDGDQHRTDRRQYVRDVRRLEALERLGWLVIRVMKEDRPADILRRVRAAIALQQSRLHDRRDFGRFSARDAASMCG